MPRFNRRRHKIHTFFSVVAHIRSKFWGLKMTNLFNRKIPEAVIDRALTIFIASAVIVFISVFLLQLTENISIAHFAINKKTEFMDTIFEAISAFGTVGLSTGTTPFLSFWGKFIIICLMFIGRVGPLTLGIALQLKQRQKIIYEFPNEEIMIS
ncbi:MAG: TrkH family potassium uptake protein [Candidatus Omnitrophica bacterium]|nr:TrkH family potassium uptake protein [Candidatus Omnitrophota bacterium]